MTAGARRAKLGVGCFSLTDRLVLDRARAGDWLIHADLAGPHRLDPCFSGTEGLISTVRVLRGDRGRLVVERTRASFYGPRTAEQWTVRTIAELVEALGEDAQAHRVAAAVAQRLGLTLEGPQEAQDGPRRRRRGAGASQGRRGAQRAV